MHNIDIEDRLAALSAAIADRTRARMLCLLMDGRAYTATELSAAVEVAPSTASAHLAKLLEQRLIACVKQGRYRYFRLAGQPVADALEGLMALAGVPRPSVKSSTPTTLQYARTCYDHMAGEVAVKLHDRLHALNWLAGEEDYRLSDAGQAALTRLGAALLAAFIQRGWILRRLDSRELQLTPAGKKALAAHFDLTV
ncbi:ArsR/SmtB family transcription factor [Serratia bockelmannii]|uniref:ArsR/SmtB family transcription factor n=1 Tax=Serratia TaxID=613 RepID=UPI00146F8C9D|nr:metalloregulator ArsR/SmtB family transcription factor [Serratia marcescens]NMT22509.1 helix-turn-helix transcriptional regulator [Serratia marcescens]